MDAELCSTECARTSFLTPSEPSLLTKNFGTRNSEMPLLPAGASGSRASTKWMMFGELVLAVGDEDFLAGDAIRAVGGALGLGAQGADVRARLRLGELHGAHPFAGDELFEIGPLQFLRAIGVERFGRTHGQHRANAEGHRGRIPHLNAGGVQCMRQACPLHCSGSDTAFQPALAQLDRPPSSRAAW